MFKNYRIGFDLPGLLLFLMIMIPNVIWFVIPAANDVLRTESVSRYDRFHLSGINGGESCDNHQQGLCRCEGNRDNHRS